MSGTQQRRTPSASRHFAVLARLLLQHGLPIGLCQLLLVSSTAGFVVLAWERGAIAAAPTTTPPVEGTTEEKSRGSLLRRLWGYTPCPPIRPDCDRNTAVDIGDALPGDFIVSKQTPYRTGRNEVLITSPSTGTEQRFEINLPETGSFQLYKAAFAKVKVSSPEKVLGAGASLSPQQVATKLQQFEIEFEQNAPKTVVLADGTRGEFSASGVVIRSKDGRVIETVGASAMQERIQPQLMAAVPMGSDAVVAQAGAGGASCQGSIRNKLYEMSQRVQQKGTEILKQKATSEEAKLIAWVTTFSRQALEDSLIADNRNQTLQEVACAEPVQCDEPQSYSGGWETRTDLFRLPGGNNAVSLRYQFYQIPDRVELWREGKLVFERGPTSGTDTVAINNKQLHGAGFVGVKLIGNPTNKGTAWNYTISCSSSLQCIPKIANNPSDSNTDETLPKPAPESKFSQPEILDRSKWGARKPITDKPGLSYEKYEKPLKDVLNSIVIHNAGNSFSLWGETLDTMKKIQDHHMDKTNRADIGYHYGITTEGVIYEGRDINVKGSHVKGLNTGKIGIVLIADLDEQWYDRDDSLTQEMETSLLNLVSHLREKYDIKFLGGHNEVNDRTCPGNIAIKKMDEWRLITDLKKIPN